MNAYLVYNDDYSRSTYHGIFLNKEEAEKCVENCKSKGVDWLSIEELPLDKLDFEPIKAYQVSFKLLVPVEQFNIVKCVGKTDTVSSIDYYGFGEPLRHLEIISNLFSWISCETEKEAIEQTEKIRLNMLKIIEYSGFDMIEFEQYGKSAVKLIDPKIGNVDPGNKVLKRLFKKKSSE